MTQAESFLRRWSRLKLHSTESAATPGPSQTPEIAAPETSEFSAFLDPKVSRDARQAALRTLFMTDHYRTMDGLDVYVDDYSKPELLAAEVLDKLEHARDLLNRAEEPKEESIVPSGVLKECGGDHHD